ncbi:glycosyltransferase family 2 protein [Candidatus Chloroploca sp. M-50]|uniref:Glycosyltransferase family 2 protein n=1 Tax=Candidatus Chloroploca mongolica TaxID=2528176 RepID=A0ABS4D9K8_9CHLR|nr:glycosyltransferase family A protein [Candidatus Chloroploca mongolica]MBP1466131.1 glycosyltransferase family 2 protein [Candidatus Chloroploca mongolica]
MSHMLLVSVIIPTHNRRASLLRCLEALAAQDMPMDQVEVIVVADSCHDASEQAARAYAAEAPFQLRVASHAARSAAATRNLGAQMARGAVLVFLDDDMVILPGCLRAHLHALQSYDVSIGYSQPIIPDRPTHWQMGARQWWEDRFRAMEVAGYRFSYHDLFSGNLAIHAELFSRVGEFDLAFAGRLEDYELGVRLLQTGARFAFTRAAHTRHYEASDLDTWVRRVGYDGEAEVQMVRKHPALRSLIFGDVLAVADTVTKVMIRVAAATIDQGPQIEQVLVALIRFAEALTLRHRRAQLLRVARDYSYWRGVARAVGGGSRVHTWLYESKPFVLAADTPMLDLADPPLGGTLDALLAAGTQQGLRVTLAGVKVYEVLPHPAAEPLRLEHIRYLLREASRHKILPGVVLYMMQKEQRLCWPV